MIRTYSVLATSDELFRSPFVSELKQRYDVVLNINEPQVINFLFQQPLARQEANFVRALYDEHTMTVSDLHVETYKNQTLISCLILVKEVGSQSLSFLLPYRLSKQRALQEKIAKHA